MFSRYKSQLAVGLALVDLTFSARSAMVLEAGVPVEPQTDPAAQNEQQQPNELANLDKLTKYVVGAFQIIVNISGESEFVAGFSVRPDGPTQSLHLSSEAETVGFDLAYHLGSHDNISRLFLKDTEPLFLLLGEETAFGNKELRQLVKRIVDQNLRKNKELGLLVKRYREQRAKLEVDFQTLPGVTKSEMILANESARREELSRQKVEISRYAQEYLDRALLTDPRVRELARRSGREFSGLMEDLQSRGFFDSPSGFEGQSDGSPEPGKASIVFTNEMGSALDVWLQNINSVRPLLVGQRFKDLRSPQKRQELIDEILVTVLSKTYAHYVAEDRGVTDTLGKQTVERDIEHCARLFLEWHRNERLAPVLARDPSDLLEPWILSRADVLNYPLNDNSSGPIVDADGFKKYVDTHRAALVQRRTELLARLASEIKTETPSTIGEVRRFAFVTGLKRLKELTSAAALPYIKLPEI